MYSGKACGTTEIPKTCKKWEGVWKHYRQFWPEYQCKENFNFIWSLLWGFKWDPTLGLMYGGELCPQLQTTAELAVCISGKERFQEENLSSGKNKSRRSGKENQESKGRTAKGWLWHRKTALPYLASRTLIEEAHREQWKHHSESKCFHVENKRGKIKAQAEEPDQKKLHLTHLYYCKSSRTSVKHQRVFIVFFPRLNLPASTFWVTLQFDEISGRACFPAIPSIQKG